MIPSELSSIFEPIAKKAAEDIKGPSLDDIPFQIGPLQYAGLGDFRPEEPDISPDILTLKPAPPTMEIQPEIDILTGKVTGYTDLPISTLSTDNPDLVRPIKNYDDYLSGLNQLPANHYEERDFSQYLAALETGTNLLTSPFNDDKSEADEKPELVDLPIIEASTVYKQEKPKEEEEINFKPSEVDTWDTKLFNKEFPNPALKFDFTPDDFQLRAMRRLERDEMVFVSAPTSAGKTLVAQYAMEIARKRKMRAIYTSPIKALSNQKYRDLSRQFGDVGILTGDVTLNRDAAILIMTTEILAQMLYRDADLLKDVDVVIFDEVHYINDPERGVIWEESIILMPPHINMVFLSATIPNDNEIADWIGRTKKKQVFIERKDKRPVPLVHCVYSDRDIHVLQEPGKPFNDREYKKMRDGFERSTKKMDQRRLRFVIETPGYWTNLVKSLQKKDMLPCLMFSFSQKKCEKFASIIGNSSIKLIQPSDVSHIEKFFRRSISRLKPSDRNLPQVQFIHDLLIKGIGVHHGGMLPILKECVEILLADGFVKLLFCTSTFAMGINVPARSCAFTSLDKFNGKEMVKLTPTEYVQMSGRAGRRGLDDRGYAILLASNECPTEQFLQDTFSCKVEELSSKFYIKYNIILNLISTQSIDMIDLIKRSLTANKLESQIPKMKEDIIKFSEEYNQYQEVECTKKDAIDSFDIEDIADFQISTQDGATTFASMIEELTKLVKQAKSLMGDQDYNRSIKKGCIVFTREFGTDIAFVADKSGTIKLETKTHTANVSADKIIAIYKNTGKNKNMRINKSEYESKTVENLELMPLKEIYNTKSLDLVEISDRHERLYKKIISHPCFTCSSRKIHTEIGRKHVTLGNKIRKLKEDVEKDQAAFMPLLQPRIDVLKDLGYISEDGTIELKGRISIELSGDEELLTTELFYNNYFNDLTPAEVVAVSSALIYRRYKKKETEDVDVPPQLVPKVIEMKETAQYLVDKLTEFGIDVDEDYVEYATNETPVTPVYLWAMGLDFVDVMKKSMIPEGELVRVILRTNNLITNFSKAAKLLGNVALQQKFDAASEAIKRDIIFAASLYYD